VVTLQKWLELKEELQNYGYFFSLFWGTIF